MTLVLLAALAWPFVPDPDPVTLVINGQLILTITAVLAVLAFKLDQLRPASVRRGLTAFLIASAAFVLLLRLDISIARAPIPALSSLDGLSLPVSRLLAAGGISSKDCILCGECVDSCATGLPRFTWSSLYETNLSFCDAVPDVTRLVSYPR